MCNLYSYITKAESAFRDLSSVHLMSYHMHMHFNVVYCEIAACVMECIIQIFLCIGKNLFNPRKAIHVFILCKFRPHDKPEMAIAKSWFPLVIRYVIAVEQSSFECVGCVCQSILEISVPGYYIYSYS